jgi:hypothetical protein
MRLSFALIVIASFAFYVLAAEELPLQPASSKVASEVKCPPYFIVTTFGGAIKPTIYFNFTDKKGEVQLGTVPTARTEVHIAAEEKATYEEIPLGGVSGAIFRLTQADYDKARACLPPATPEPTK